MVLFRLPLLVVAASIVGPASVMGATEESYGQLRGSSSFLEDANLQNDVKQYECTIEGSSGQDACDVRVQKAAELLVYEFVSQSSTKSFSLYGTITGLYCR